MRRSMLAWILVVVAVAAGAAAAATRHRPRSSASEFRGPSLPVGPVQGIATTREELSRATLMLNERLATNPDDGGSAAALAEVLLRRSRVEGKASYTVDAERALDALLQRRPDDYAARRALGMVLMSQHRFEEAERSAREAIALRPQDAWNYGVLGDAVLEQGRREEAFAAFDRMMRARPDAAAYARVAYAQELQGDLDAALRSMRMAAEATSPRDPESQAWHYAQVGNLLLQLGDVTGASREFARADFVFPGHPDAASGQVRARLMASSAASTMPNRN
jgi:tetratricopeptide (TPR) repeat protein